MVCQYFCKSTFRNNVAYIFQELSMDLVKSCRTYVTAEHNQDIRSLSHLEKGVIAELVIHGFPNLHQFVDSHSFDIHLK